MKTAICILSLVFLQLGAFAGVKTDILETNRVILKAGDWKPTVEEMQKTLSAVQSFMETHQLSGWEKGEMKKILKNTKNYRVQFLGVLCEGRKLIRCHFLPIARKGEEDECQDWQQREISMKDGGYWFWHIDYDPSTEKCMNFMSNGEA